MILNTLFVMERTKFRQPYDPTQFMDVVEEKLHVSISKNLGPVQQMNGQAAFLIVSCASAAMQLINTKPVSELDDFIEGLVYALQTGTPRERL